MNDDPVIESGHDMRKFLASKGATPEEIQQFMQKTVGKDPDWQLDYFASLVMIISELGMDRVVNGVLKNVG